MKKTKAFLAAFLLAVSSLFVLAAPKAFAATKTWDGGGSDNNMTTAANWNADSAPSAGDDLVFPANISDKTITNDFAAATSFNSITFSGTATQASDYTISGNSITLVAGITNSMTGSFATYATLSLPLILNGTQTFDTGESLITVSGTLNLGSSALTISGSGISTISGVISGTGSITKTGTGDFIIAGDNTYSGATTVSAGTLIMKHANALGTSAGGTTVSSGAVLYFAQATGDVTISEPLTLSGTGVNSYLPVLSVNLAYNQSVQPVVPFPQTTFSGTITLGSNINFGASLRNAKITGAITGNYTITLTDPSSGSVQIASSDNGSATSNQTLSPPVKTTTYAADEPSTGITVNTNETAVVTGTYGDVTVYPGGTLKGTGTVGAVTAYGKVSPGLSPGCLNTGDLSFLETGTYDFEIGGTTACTHYDQIKVTGGVSLDGTLAPILFNGYKPKVGEKYIIISNDGSDAVTGTFNDIAEGGTVTADGYSYKVSYVGGDGNDVELTVLVAAPATGFALFKSNPAITASVIIMAAFGILVIARRSGKMFSRR